MRVPDSVLLLSGGLDSAVLLGSEVAAGRWPWCLAFRYGQRHDREVRSSWDVAAFYGCLWECCDLPAGLMSGSALTGGGPVPQDTHYADPVQAATVVPNRNMAFIAMAGARAAGAGASVVLVAAHAGDAHVYPDCRPGFIAAADTALRLACGVRVEAPFLALSKRDIIILGRQLGVPIETTWSCYVGGESPCGRCGACVERAEATR